MSPPCRQTGVQTALKTAPPLTGRLPRWGPALTVGLAIGMLAVPGRAQPSSVPQGSMLADQSVELSRLAAYLETQHWAAADQETRRILQGFVHPDGDIFAEPVPTLIPPAVLQHIDQLWIAASGGRFGVSVQLALWEALRTQYPTDPQTLAQRFGDRVGWTRTVPSEAHRFTALDWLTEPELTYSLEAPVGHLPWVGIDWACIEAILTDQSYGSCTIDALYLQGDRFLRYLPALFSWGQTALRQPIPEPVSWHQAQLAHQIDLRSLYPNRTCPVRVTDATISPDGRLMAIASLSAEPDCSTTGESGLALWDTQRGNRIVTLHRTPGEATSSQPLAPGDDQHRGEVVTTVAFTPDGQFLAAVLSSGRIRLWRTHTWEPIQRFRSHDQAVQAMAFGPDGYTLVSASPDQTLKRWDLRTGEVLWTIALDPSDGSVRSLRVSPDSQRLATATDRNTLQLWNLQRGQRLRTLVEAASHLPLAKAIAFSPDGQTLATADTDHSVKLWNPSTGARVITLRGHTKLPQGLAFSPDGRVLASSDGETARLWNLADYTPIHRLVLGPALSHPMQTTPLAAVAFSPDSQTLAASALLPSLQSDVMLQPGILLWQVETGQPVGQIRAVRQFQFSPDGRFLMATGQTVQLWAPDRSLF